MEAYGKRILVVGSTGSGKTTLARRLSELLAVPHVELDALHWEPGWKEAAEDVFRQRVEEAVIGDGWVVDGNYSVVRNLLWPRATALVWLDYPLRLIMWWLLCRTFRRIVRREELWSGNQERFAAQFFSRESLFLWALRTHWRRRRTYSSLVRQPEYAHLKVVHLRSPRETQAWLSRLGTVTNEPDLRNEPRPSS